MKQYSWISLIVEYLMIKNHMKTIFKISTAAWKGLNHMSYYMEAKSRCRGSKNRTVVPDFPIEVPKTARENAYALQQNEDKAHLRLSQAHAL